MVRAVRLAVASVTKRNEIMFDIFAPVASKLFVVNLQIRHRSAYLAAPVVATENPLP